MMEGKRDQEFSWWFEKMEGFAVAEKIHPEKYDSFSINCSGKVLTWRYDSFSSPSSKSVQLILPRLPWSRTRKRRLSSIAAGYATCSECVGIDSHSASNVFSLPWSIEDDDVDWTFFWYIVYDQIPRIEQWKHLILWLWKMEFGNWQDIATKNVWDTRWELKQLLNVSCLKQ